jgi:hypothetical protein
MDMHRVEENSGWPVPIIPGQIGLAVLLSCFWARVRKGYKRVFFLPWLVWWSFIFVYFVLFWLFCCLTWSPSIVLRHKKNVICPREKTCARQASFRHELVLWTMYSMLVNNMKCLQTETHKTRSCAVTRLVTLMKMWPTTHRTRTLFSEVVVQDSLIPGE